MSGRDLTDEDKVAWEAATRHVRPISKKGAPKPVPQTLKRPSGRSGPKTSPKHPAPQNRSNERAVRRGRQQVAASFDLHGHSQDSAWRALPIFLRQAQANGARCVIVITGKGRAGNGVLRRNFLHWLEAPEAANLVSGYAPAHPRHGGSGAWYVYLRKV